MTEMVHEDLREQIMAANAKLMALYRQGDAAGIAELYTEDAVLMPPNIDFVHGKQGIQHVFETFMGMGIKALVFEVIEATRCGDMAVEMSRYTLLGSEEQQLDQGKYIVVWKNVHGVWKLHRDIFNSSMPAAG